MRVQFLLAIAIIAIQLPVAVKADDFGSHGDLTELPTLRPTYSAPLTKVPLPLMCSSDEAPPIKFMKNVVGDVNVLSGGIAIPCEYVDDEESNAQSLVCSQRTEKGTDTVVLKKNESGRYEATRTQYVNFPMGARAARIRPTVIRYATCRLFIKRLIPIH